MKNLKTISGIILLTILFSLSACSEKKEEKIKEPQGYLIASFTVPSESKESCEKASKQEIEKIFKRYLENTDHSSAPYVLNLKDTLHHRTKKENIKGLEKVLEFIFPSMLPKKEDAEEAPYHPGEF